MSRSLREIVFVGLVSSALLVSGCAFGGAAGRPDFSGIKSMADLSTLRCYYHNVAEVRNDGSDYLFGIVVVGYKRAWYEYQGYVELGVNMNDVKISGPDANGVVKVRLPEVKVIDVDADEESIDEVCYDTGIFQHVTIKDKTKAYSEAQAEMEQAAEEDEVLRQQAEMHAKDLVEAFIKNVGESMDESYTVEWES